MVKRFFVPSFLFFLMMVIPGYSMAAVSASISPSGSLMQVSNVPVTFTYNFSDGFENANIVNYNVKFNVVDQTQSFMSVAQFSNTSSSEVKAEIEYLFAPGA